MQLPNASAFQLLRGEPSQLQLSLAALQSKEVDLRLASSNKSTRQPCAMTIAGPVEASGPATYSRGKTRILRFLPSEKPGWHFRRTDLPNAPEIPALLSSVSESNRAIVLRHGLPANRIRMSEHIVCHRLGLGIDNLLIECASEDPPLFDSGSMEIVEALRQAGRHETSSALPYYTVSTPVAFLNPERGSLLAWLPAAEDDFQLHLDVAIDFPTAIGHQRLQFDLTPDFFENGCHARTNCSEQEWRLAHIVGWLLPRYRSLGYTPKNILVAGKRSYWNTPRLLLENGKSLEAVWHRACMDLVAALSLLPHGRYAGTLLSYKAGHALDVDFLKLLLAKDLLTQLP